MAELAVRICEHYQDVDRDLVIVGVLFHDIGKLRELGAMPANDYTLEGRLIGHVVIGRDLLRDRCRAIEGFPEDLQLLLEHLVLSHQGKKEFASPVEPMTPEALVLHFVDDLDSKLNQLRAVREANPGIQYHRGLARYVYLPPVVEARYELDPHADEAHEPEAEAMIIPDVHALVPPCPEPAPAAGAAEAEEIQPPLFGR
jgi:3'-5' exoribonuclease